MHHLTYYINAHAKNANLKLIQAINDVFKNAWYQRTIAFKWSCSDTPYPHPPLPPSSLGEGGRWNHLKANMKVWEIHWECWLDLAASFVLFSIISLSTYVNQLVYNRFSSHDIWENRIAKLFVVGQNYSNGSEYNLPTEGQFLNPIFPCELSHVNSILIRKIINE